LIAPPFAHLLHDGVAVALAAGERQQDLEDGRVQGQLALDRLLLRAHGFHRR